ncbi:MAG TPA: T9SS type A sorting domain-containing protein [Ignavibacteriales bacterium]|nr:T9SS type A sorting domain-containing protein [Ignavibacteriales bacterium]
MKIFITCLLALFLVENVFSQDQKFWQKLNPPSGAYVTALTSDSSGNIYAGTIKSGVYRSSDKGSSWTRINNGIKGYRIITIQNQNNNVFAGSSGNGVFRSSDNGSSWTQINNGLSGRALTVNAITADIYFTYAGTNTGLFHSTDNGDSWTQVSGAPDTGVTALAVGNGYLHVATRGQGLYLSGDHGGHWEQVNNGLSGVALEINTLMINSTYIYIGTDGDGVYRTSDNGKNWTQIINGMTKLRVFSLAQDGTYIYAGTNDGVYRSSDNGDNWSRQSSGITAPYGNALLTGPNYLLAGTNQGLFKSSDQAGSWQKANNGINAYNILTLEITDNYIFAGANGGALRSSDNGNSWENIDNGLKYVAIFSLIKSGNFIFAGTREGGVYRSSDNGNNWSQVNNNLKDNYGNILASGGGFIYVGTNKGVFRSSDNGDNWTEVNNGLSTKGVLSFAVGSSFIYAGTSNGVFRSSDNGNSWTKASNGLPNSEVYTMITHGGNVYAGFINEGVFRSADNGNNWTKINNGLPDQPVTQLAADNSTIYAGTDGSGVYQSKDNGDSWTQVNNGLLNLHMTTIKMGQNGYLYAVSFDPSSDNGIGIYRSVNSSTPSITVTAPKQGDSWQAGSTQTVTWTSSNLSGNVNIKISFDEGATFPSTLAGNTANDNSESVTVPDTSSSQCRIKIESADNASVFALNNGNFTIVGKSSLKVTSPPAGANWTIGSTQAVTWTSRNFNGNVNIRLSTDGGKDFSTILKSNTGNDGTEEITVPDKPSNTCRIKIESVSDTSISGLNPGTFTISSKPSISVTEPAAGAKWTVGSSQFVKWTSVNVAGNVNIKLSTDGGNTFSSFIENTPNDSTEAVTVPELPSSAACRIRVESVNDTSIKGLNPGNFTITAKPAISVTLPQSGANWTVGTTEKVNWISSNLTGNVNIKISTDGGSTFEKLVENTPDDSSETITVPDLPSATCRIRVESANDTSIHALNPGNFTIMKKPETPVITVSQPAAGADWIAGSVQTVAWTGVNFTGNVNILLSTDGGKSFSKILKADTPNDSSESVTVPDSPSTDCRVMVQSVSDTTIKGLNPGKFIISSKPQIFVTAPQALDKWTIGSQQTVIWTSNNISGNVNIKLSTNGGSSFSILVSNSQSSGSEKVTVPNSPSATCRIKVESVNDTTVFGLNPGNFTITSKPTLSVTSPQEGANWTIGSRQAITWKSNGVNGNVDIRLSVDGGVSFPDSLMLAANTANDSSETITVPNHPSQKCRILIESVGDTTIKGISPGNFTITAKPTITVTSPQTGANWAIGSVQKVKWTSYNVSGNVNIKLSSDGGNTFKPLLNSVPDNDSVNITVPSNPSSICRIKVESAADTTVYGLNPGNFAITSKPNIIITAPEAGTEWEVGASIVITWVPVNVSGNINIKLSTDGGSSFSNLLANTANDGSETITVPDKPSANCKLKVESVSDTSIFAITQGNFSIIKVAAKLTVMAPLAGAVWLAGNSQAVKWSSLNVSGNVNIRFSSDGGKSFPVSLISNTPNDEAETITVPNASSSVCRIKVESVNDTSISGISGDFTVVNYPATVTLNNTYSFGDIKDINNYKIIGVPGRGLIPVTMSGDFLYDWNVYWDKGTEKDYLVDSSSFVFSPGRAFWILSKSQLNISRTVTAVSINDADFSYSIPLHPGWNLISNPFEKNVKWQSVVQINKLSPNQLLYSWNGKGSYTNPADMKPFEGYYYNNDSANFLTSLKIPYDVSGTAQKNSAEKIISSDYAQEYPVDIKKFLWIRLTSQNDEASEVFIGVNPASKDGFDKNDYYAAPGDFQSVGINLLKPEMPERNRYLYIEQRPQIGKGQKFDLEIKAIPGHPVTLSALGLENFGNYGILLLDETTKNFIDLKLNKTSQLTLAHKLNPFSLFIGSDEYITGIKQSIPPLSYELFQNYPNPFNPSTTIRFSLPEKDKVTLKIYNVLGQLVTTLINEQLYDAGSYELQFNGAELASGIYIMRIDSQKFSMQRKIVLLK